MELPEHHKGRMPLGRLRRWARMVKSDILALYLAVKHVRTPLYAKVLAAIVVGYALSPIDLIPDFIPVLGYIDDIILLPLGIALVIKLLPSDVLKQCREEARTHSSVMRPKIWLAAYVIIMLWLAAAYLLYEWLL